MITWLLAALSIALAVAVVLLLRRQPAVAVERRPRRQVERWDNEIVDHLDLGVLVLDASLVPVYANAAARQALDLPDDLPVRVGPDELLSVARRAWNSADPIEAEVAQGGKRVRFFVTRTSSDRLVLSLRDVTDEVETQQVRRQFVLNASHELKTPVAGIRALAESLDQAVDDDPLAAKTFAHQLLGEADRLSRLTQDLLDLSRLEDPSRFSAGSFDLVTATQQQIETLRELAEDREVSVGLDAPSELTVRGDENQISLMARNLIDNAVRYTTPGGNVSVTISRDREDAVLKVEDTGVGIPLNAQARVFERFYRVDEDRGRRSGGTGLGLAIVKHVAEMHGGRVALKSELGEGSTFEVRLPLVEPEPR